MNKVIFGLAAALCVSACAFQRGTAPNQEAPVTAAPAQDDRTPEGVVEPEGFVFVEGGTFMMGSADSEANHENDESQHQVTVHSFFLGKYEVTQNEWRSVMGTNLEQQRNTADPSWPILGAGDFYPIYYVNWYEAVEFCNKRSLKEGLTPCYHGSGDSITCDWKANGYRLPTEAEWEYAAKGGKDQYLTYMYSGSNSVEAIGWYGGNSGDRTHEVGTKQANGLGIYDMSGNVWEWCWDWYGDYRTIPQTDPTGASTGSGRLVRGGGWYNGDKGLRSAYRVNYIPSYRSGSVGFRLLRPAE